VSTCQRCWKLIYFKNCSAEFKAESRDTAVKKVGFDFKGSTFKFNILLSVLNSYTH
jgi:hypothetical protein